MKEIIRLSIHFLIKNKKRTIFSLIGIILSVVLMSSVLSLRDTITTYNQDVGVYTNGSWLLSDSSHDESHMEDVIEKAPIKDSLTVSELGVSPTDDDMYLEILGYSDFSDIYPLHLISGSYPKNDNEIVVPQAYLSEYNLAVGNKIEFEIGNRTLYDGYIERNINEMQDYVDGELYLPMNIKKYTIVGTYDDFKKPSTATATKYRFVTKSFDTSIAWSTYYTIENISEKEWEELKSNMGKSAIYNKEAEVFYIDKGFHLSFELGLSYSIILVVLALNMIGLIKNTFDVSLKERSFVLVTLQCIGATPSQIKFIFISEAVILGILSIPLGILLSSTLLKLMYQYYSHLIFLDTNIPIEFKLIVNPSYYVLITILILMVLVYCAWKTTRHIFDTSSVDLAKKGMMEENFVGVRPFKRNIRIETTIGLRNSKVNKKAYRSIVFSLSMSIILFLSGNYLVNSISSALYGNQMNEEAITVMLKDTANMKQFQKMLITKDDLFALNKEGESKFISYFMTSVKIPHKNTSSQCKNVFKQFEKDGLTVNIYTTASKKNNEDHKIHISIDNYVQFEKKNKEIINVQLLDVDTNDVLTLPYQFISNNMFQKGSLSFIVDNVNEKSVTKESQSIYYEDDRIPPSVNIIVSLEDYQTLLSKLNKQFQDIIAYHEVRLYNEDHDALSKRIQSYKQENADKIDYVNDPKLNIESSPLLSAFRLLFNMFSLLILLICMMNILNTVLSSILSKKKEIAVLESIGLDSWKAFKMVFYENISFVIASLLIAIPVSLLINFALYFIGVLFHISYFDFGWLNILFIIGAVFCVGILAIMLGWYMIYRESIIDKIRNTDY